MPKIYPDTIECPYCGEVAVIECEVQLTPYEKAAKYVCIPCGTVTIKE